LDSDDFFLRRPARLGDAICQAKWSPRRPGSSDSEFFLRRPERPGDAISVSRKMESSDHDGISMSERLIISDANGDNETNEHTPEKLDNATFAIILTTNSFDSADKSLLTPAFRVLVLISRSHTNFFVFLSCKAIVFRKWNSRLIQNRWEHSCFGRMLFSP
jgi:hypothetical protein